MPFESVILLLRIYPEGGLQKNKNKKANHYDLYLKLI